MPSSIQTTIGGLKISINNNNPQRVQSINYGLNQSFRVSRAADVTLDITADNTNSVLTYDDSTQKFVVQSVPRLDGGTF